MGDYIPAWAGGLPKGAPPRSTDPRYAKFIEEQHSEAPKSPLADANKLATSADAIH
jgi:hypothetical protein